MQDATLSAHQEGRVRPDLQSVIPQASRLVSLLRTRPAEAMSLEVKDTVDALVVQLDDAAARRYAGEIGIDNGAVCSIACDSAHLLAAMMSPGEPFNLTALPSDARDAFDALQGQLYRLGLMDAYWQGGDVYDV